MTTRSLIGATLAAVHFAGGAVADAQESACVTRSSGQGRRVEEAKFVELGGLEQWVTIRGDDTSNPILLHVHGGPGIAFSAFTAEFAPYEADFTVVQWDQRGSGCTFGRRGPDTPDLTLDRIARDGIELVEHLEQRFRSPRVIVLGHSFGSIVAMEMVQHAPQHFAAYVGTAQFGSLPRTVDAQIAYLRKRAASGDTELSAELDELASLDSRSFEKFGAVNRLLASRGPAVDMGFLQRLPSRAAEVMAAQELANWQTGRGASMAQLIPQVSAVDLFATVARLEVPFVVIQGADDVITPTDVAAALFEHVEAPAKELVVVAGAGHFPHLTHTKDFLAALARTPALR